ncbi:trichohyalin-like isoform X2 [Solea solea]|uniref:trichohyalin-like isoform X2 n=1 Tax=Solea solea TaxID=90069 RepID=UPI00272A8F03|nr:trichohyalin-like isoform X2 [Solea solea]
MASSETMGTGSTFVTVAVDSLGTDPHMWGLCNRIKVLEQRTVSTVQSDCYLRNSMQHCQRLDQRLHVLREEVRTMTQEKERGERVWRERLQRCQRQLKAKEDEMSRQSQYFENFKTQLQHKLSLAREREQSLQSRIFTLEKQLLDLTVSAATGMATVRAVRITAGTVTTWEVQDRLTSMRGEGEGEEENKEERMKQWQPRVLMQRNGGLEGDEGTSEKEIEGGRDGDTKQNSNETRLQGFILSLQEDLRVLLERVEDGMTERTGLTEQLQEAQENNHVLVCKVEEMKAEVHQLKLSEGSLMEEVDELREENDKLQLILGEAAHQTTAQLSTVHEPVSLSSGMSSSSVSPTVCSGLSSVESSGEVQVNLSGGIDEFLSSAAPCEHHQVSAEGVQSQSDCGFNNNLSFQSLSLTRENIGEIKVASRCPEGLLNLEGNYSEESEALREAYKSLGIGEDLEALQEQCDRLESALQHTQEQLEVVAQENTRLKVQLRNQVEEQASGRRSSPEKADHGLAQDDLVQALNQENRALADRIQELLTHIELREEEIKMEQTQLREHATGLEEDRARLEQENQEQGCLITELTRKTEDDLNTIMDLQQKVEDGGQRNIPEEHVDSVVESVLKEEEDPPGGYKSDREPLQNNPLNPLHVNTLTDEVEHLTMTIQSLRTEQGDLVCNINSLREQQGEVALSIQTKTEEKQQLTRAVWGLKEERDSISHCLADLKQEREQLNRTVCGLRDKRDNFVKSMSDLREEKAQLTKTLCALGRENEALTEHLSSGKEKRDQIMQSLQSLHTESDHLTQVVLNLKQERDGLAVSLKEQEDQRQSTYASQDERDALMMSVSSLTDEKERAEHSITCLKVEERQIMLAIQGLREERNGLQSALSSQMQADERNQRQNAWNQSLISGDTTKTAETLVWTGDVQRCHYKENSAQEESDLLREIEALGEQLKRSQEELDKSHTETKRLHSELCQLEIRREEAERTAAEKGMRLASVAYEMEETRRDNECLSGQVTELQSKVTNLVREKSEALSLKKQTEEEYNILTALLKAKTVALDELNHEYIALKRGQVCKDDLSAALMSVRTRYNDIRAKYDALLKKRSQTDLDVAPLKAKLSCLVVKCQERNSLLGQMMKAAHRRGCIDFTLRQRVEQLLEDAALQDYTVAFTPGSFGRTGDYTAGFTPKVITEFPDEATGFTSANEPKCQNGFSPKSELKGRDLKSETRASISVTEPSTNLQDCRSEVRPAAAGTLQRDANSTAPNTLVQDSEAKAVFSAAKESLITNTAQLFPSASGPVPSTRGSEFSGFHPDSLKGKSPDLISSSGSLVSPTRPCTITRVSLNRRLSSPEKIMNLHEQLQKTLMGSFQVPVSRGRRQEPRKSLSVSSAADLNLSSQTNKQSFNKPRTNSLHAAAASSRAMHRPVVTTKPAATLFNAVVSRSANAAFSPNSFTYNHFKADKRTTSTPALSTSSDESASNSGANRATSPEMTTTVAAISNISDTMHTAPPPSTLRTNAFDSNDFKCFDSNPKTTASDTTAPGKSTAPKLNGCNGAASAYEGFLFTASSTHSPERSHKSAAQEKTKSTSLRLGAPAEVRSVEVIKTVGQSSLLIGWERPPLDELGCSNSTFVYGYRVFIDGDFHKSVMSSACTKCIVENVDVSVPVHIGVQTLGSNGLCSNRVHVTYRTSDGTDQN